MDMPIFHDKIVTIYVSLTGRIAEIECSKNVYKRGEFFNLVKNNKLIIENAVITDNERIVFNTEEFKDNIRIIHKNLEFPIYNMHSTREPMIINKITKTFVCIDTRFTMYRNIVKEISISTQYPAIAALLEDWCDSQLYSVSLDRIEYGFKATTLKHLIKKSENLGEFFHSCGIVLDRGVLTLTNKAKTNKKLRYAEIEYDDTVLKNLETWEIKMKALGLYDNYEIDKEYELLIKCNKASNRLIIPPVTVISHDCFDNISNPEIVQEIIIPDTVEVIHCTFDKFKNAKIKLGKNVFYFKGYTKANSQLEDTIIDVFDTYNIGETTLLPKTSKLILNLTFKEFDYDELYKADTVELVENKY